MSTLPSTHSSPSFKHGIHPEEHKEQTAHIRISRMPFVPRYILPLSQHTGAPSKPIVRTGERVQRGQCIAEAQGFVSVALHAPATGRVRAIRNARHPNGRLVPCIEIETDPFSAQKPMVREPLAWQMMTRGQFVEAVQAAGLVGLGGAAFPSHVKYAIPEGKRIERLVVNGCECEPYLTCDHRVMVERARAIVEGVVIVASQLEVEAVTIAVELNKPDAVTALQAEVGLVKTRGSKIAERIVVQPVQVKYPQGAEKMLIEALFGTQVPAGKLPLDVGMVVNNVGTMAGIADWFDHGEPLMERVVTVAGPGIREPANLLVPIGTSVREVLEHCGGLRPETRDVILGGPMMGQPLANLDVPVLKGTSGILALTEMRAGHAPEYSCVRCGRCLEACPNFLNPSRLSRLARAGRYEEMEASFALDCMECGSCSFVCPSNIPIVHLIRAGKSYIRERAAETQKKK